MVDITNVAEMFSF